jgi:chromosome segregation ATPase
VVNEIEKLNKVIGSLEEQATRVTEFNGILAAVNEARSEIESSKKILENASSQHQQFIEDNHSKFEKLLERLDSIEKKLADLEQGQDKCLRKISELKFLTPEKFDEGRKASDIEANERVLGLIQKIKDANQAHQSSLKTLKFVTIFGMLLLAIGIAFLARG